MVVRKLVSFGEGLNLGGELSVSGRYLMYPSWETHLLPLKGIVGHLQDNYRGGMGRESLSIVASCDGRI